MVGVGVGRWLGLGGMVREWSYGVVAMFEWSPTQNHDAGHPPVMAPDKHGVRLEATRADGAE